MNEDEYNLRIENLANQIRKSLYYQMESKIRFDSFLFWRLSSIIHHYLLEKSRPTKSKGHGYIWKFIISVLNVLIHPIRPRDKEAQTPM